MTGAAPGWDDLAPVWEHLEGGGLNARLIATLVTSLETPLLHVGGGRGSLTALLASRLGGSVTHLDASMAMCARARQDFGLVSVVAEADDTPFPDGTFAAVLCSTGVLEFADADGRAAALAEMRRLVAPGGPVVVAAACSDSDVHWDVDQHRLVEAWYAGAGDTPAAAAFDAVAAAVGGRPSARALLLRALPRVGRAVASSDLAAAAARAGLRIEAARLDDGIGVWRLSPAG
jgi:ubiquinone/menaquinone biosynthesis C-methylase UbiE